MSTAEPFGIVRGCTVRLCPAKKETNEAPSSLSGDDHGAALVLSSGRVALALTKTQRDPPRPTPPGYTSSYSPKCSGTQGSDHLKGTEGGDYIVGDRGDDTVEGFAGSDYLFGGPDNDKLVGGLDPDKLQGDEGDDVLEGGEDQRDSYFPGNRAWGNDVIVDVASPGNDPSAGNTLWMGAAIIAMPPNLTNVDLRIDLNSSGDRHEVQDASGTNTIDWDGNLISAVRAGGGNDTIIGNDEANSLNGGLGEDTIYGGGGDDVIDVDDVVRMSTVRPRDVVECGKGKDTRSVDVIASDCEKKIRR